MAYQMLAVGVGWQVYALTSSALDLGFVGLVQFLPALLLVLVSGHVADRYDRRAVVRICQMIEAMAVGALAILSACGWISVGFIFALIALVGSARAFEAPTLQALLPGLIPTPLLRAPSASHRRIRPPSSSVRRQEACFMHWPDGGLCNERVALPRREYSGGGSGSSACPRSANR
jgi:MFS family permease